MENKCVIPVIGSVIRSLSVLVPALNEGENLGPTVKRLLQALTVTIEDYEIIIINDGSMDGTRQMADQLANQNANIKALHNQHCTGLGYAYQQGIDVATKNYFVYIPGDNTWPYRSFLELFGNLGKADVVTSYSTNPAVRIGARRIVSRAYTVMLNTIFGYHLHYFNGLTIYPRSFLQTKPVTTHSFAFQAEVLIKAIDQGLSYIEVAIPIDWRTAGKSKAVNLKNIFSVALVITRLFWNLRLNSRRLTSFFPHGNKASQDPSVAICTATAQASAGTELFSSEGASLNIVITGASSGIGAELTKALAGDNHKLFVCARREVLLREVTGNGTIARFAVCDVTDEQQVKAFATQVERQMSCVDVLLNCAGSFGAIGPIEETSSDEWFNTVKLNLFGSYLMTKHFLAMLGKSSYPKIINFSGGGAFSPFPNYSAYACSKAAVVRLTECLALEVASRGIAVNAIAPGIVATPAHEATLRAGEGKTGALYYRRTKALLEDGGVPMRNVIACVRALLSPELRALSGKTISVNFDPWNTDAFKAHIEDITRSDLYTMRRINIVNLPDGLMRTNLSEAWASFGTEQ